MMKFFSVSVAFLVALAASGLISPTYAQDESAPAAAESSSVIPVPKIAIINGQKIMRESLAAQSLLKQVDLVRRKERDRIAKLEDTLRDGRQEIDRQRTVLSPQAYEDKVREWERKSGGHVQEAEKRKRALDISLERSLAKIQNSLFAIIQDISDERQINLVFSKHQVLFGDPTMQITDEAMVRINKELPSVKLTPIDEVVGKGGQPK